MAGLRFKFRVQTSRLTDREGMQERLLISADEINCLIYSYFRDSGEQRFSFVTAMQQFIVCCTGFQHSAFTLRSEAQLELSPYFNQHIPRGELVELLSKALLFTEAEKHWKNNFACKSGFSLLTPHICNSELPKSTTKRTDLTVTDQQRPERQPQNGVDGTIAKRKVTPPLSNETRAEKRPRIEQNNATSTVPECCFFSSPLTRLSDFRVLVSESKGANQGSPNFVDSPPDPPSEKPSSLVSADHDANTPAVQLLTGHTSEVCDTCSATIPVI